MITGLITSCCYTLTKGTIPSTLTVDSQSSPITFTAPYPGVSLKMRFVKDTSGSTCPSQVRAGLAQDNMDC